VQIAELAATALCNGGFKACSEYAGRKGSGCRPTETKGIDLGGTDRKIKPQVSMEIEWGSGMQGQKGSQARSVSEQRKRVKWGWEKRR